jgi:hypothetical protein
MRAREPIGVHRGEDEPHQASAQGRDQRRPVATGRIHDRADIVDPGLDRRQGLDRHRVGHADATLVERDEPPDLREPSPQLRDRRHVPLGFLMTHPLVRQDEIDRPLAEDLVGEVQAVDAGVVRLWIHLRRIAIGTDRRRSLCISRPGTGPGRAIPPRAASPTRPTGVLRAMSISADADSIHES